jgi:bacterioferritin (cytochrome b1)
MMSSIEGASSSLNLTKQGIINSIDEEKESRDLLLKCIALADDVETKSLLKSIIVDEEHHIKILEHIEELVSSSGK